MKRDMKSIIYFNAVALILFIIVGVYNFLFFHTIIELSTIFLGVFIYLIAVYSRKYSGDNNFVFIGIAYLFIGAFDLLYTLAYEGIGIFDFSISVAARFWIGARFMESFTLFFAFHKLLKLEKINVKKVFAWFTVVSFTMIVLIYFSSYFPKLYIEGSGYTNYKRILDLIIILMFVLALYVVNRNETRIFNKRTLLLAVTFKVISVFFSLIYFESEEVFLLLSHVFKYLSYVLLFVVFARESLIRPYENIFRAFKDKEDELLKLSQKDSLTGLYNHSTSYEIIRDIIKENEMLNLDMSLMMIDVDDFKNINDKFGHVKGDEILVGIADIFKHCTGPLKLAGRYGGDEFIILFTDCNGKKAIEIANKISTKMEELSLEVKIKVTLSIGISEFVKGFTAKELVNAADIQMYNSKSLGKNNYSIKTKN